jgi:aminopeptidase N
MIFFYGKETLKEGLKTYFAKYSFKNTVLSDFVNELANAAVKVGAVVSPQEMINWSEQWLKTAGCAKISLEYQNNEGILESVKVKQTPYNVEKVTENRLRA